MINLTSLSALIRTLRQTSGVDGPAVPVARTSAVTAVAGDDAGAMMSAALRASPWARTQSPLLAVLDPAAEPRNTELRRDALVAVAKTVLRPGVVVQPAGTGTEETESTALDFTAGARLLQAALRGTGQNGPAPPTITSASPLVLDARASAPELAHGLQSAVAESGLFYESHLARALRREYPMAALAREPQASWPASPAAEGMTATVNASARTDDASMLLGRQLDLLDTRSLAWTGDLWPGQRAKIEFEEERQSSDAATDEPKHVAAPSAWHTRIALDLPSLGRVHATLDWRGGALSLKLAAATPEAESRLHGAKALLATSLEDAQVALSRFDVTSGPTP